MSKTIRAKFRCESATMNGDTQNVTLQAVTDGSEENKSFSKWTPAATVNISISNPEAMGTFVEGEEYYGDFTKATKPAEQAEEAAKPE